MSVALSCALRGLDPLRHGLPIDVAEERIDVLGCRGAKVHLVGVLVHVHHQERSGRRWPVGMIGKPVVLELLKMAVEPEHNPSGAATQPGADAAELCLPRLEAAE